MEDNKSRTSYGQWGSWIVLTACAGAVSVGLERFVIFLTKADCNKLMLDYITAAAVVILALIFNLVRMIADIRSNAASRATAGAAAKHGTKTGRAGRYGIITAILLAAAWMLSGYYLFRQDIINFLNVSVQGIVPVINSYYHVHILYRAENGISYISQTIGALMVLAPFYAGITWEIVVRLKSALAFALFGILFAVSLLLGLVPGILPVAFMLVGAIAVVPASQGRTKGAYEAAILGCIAVAAAVIAHSTGTPMVTEVMKTTEDTKVKVAAFWNDSDSRWNINNIIPSMASGGINGGQLGRTKGFSYTDKTHLELKVDVKPEGPVYMRAFIGGDYTGDSWTAADESREHLADNIAYNAYEQIYRYRRDVSGVSSMEVSRVRASDQYVYRPYALGQNTYPEASQTGYSYTFYQTKWPVGVYYAGALNDTQMSSQEKSYRNYVYKEFTNVPSSGLETLKDECRQADMSSFALAYKFILTRLNENCTYNANVGMTPEDADFINYFMYDRHEGYCSHFATTATMMFRMAGYPARYVTGYVADRDSFVETGYNEYTADVKDRTAHAWTEVYIDGTGWVVVDATPGHARSNEATVYSITSSAAAVSNMSSQNSQNNAGSSTAGSSTDAGGASGMDDSESQQTDAAGGSNSGNGTGDASSDGSGAAVGGIVIPPVVIKILGVTLRILAVCIAVLAAVTVLVLLSYYIMRTIVWRKLRLPAMDNSSHTGSYNRIVEKKFHWLYNIALTAGLPKNINSAGMKFTKMFEEHFGNIDAGLYRQIIDIVRRANYSDDSISYAEADKVVRCCRLMLMHEEHRLALPGRWRMYFNILTGRNSR